MNATRFLPLLLGAVLAACGCKQYEYRVLEPAHTAGLIEDKRAMVVRYDPLDYRLSRYHDHVAVRIINPTGDAVMLLGQKSYVVDPQGESHPLRGQPIGPHSHIWLLLPPVPASYTVAGYPSYYGAWSPGWYHGHEWGPYWAYGPWPYYEPYAYSYDVYTPFDWTWNTGEARLHLAYSRGDEKFEHQFVFLKQEKP